MSEEAPDKIIPIAGWRAEDARAIFRVFNDACHRIGPNNVPEHVIARRMRLLGSWLIASAETVFDPDGEERAVAAVDRFFERRAAGWRGDDDA